MKNNYLKNIFSKTIIYLSISLSACNHDIRNTARNLDSKIDPNVNLGYEDYRKKLTESDTKKDKSISPDNAPPLPELSSIISKPKTPLIGVDKLVTIAVTEDVPLKDVLIELSRTADIDIELDHNISGGIIFKVTNKPFNEVIERICNLASLRFYNHNGVLKIERDIPYLENYALDFLNIDRSNNNTSQLNTAMSSGSSSSGSSSSSSGGQGSTSSLKSSYDGNLWLSVENDIKKILAIGQNNDNKSSNTVVANNNENGNYISINKQTGIVSIYANYKLQKQIADYLEKVKRSASSQVLIEAKIVEINLNDSYKMGVNWSDLNNRIAGYATGFNFESGITDSNKIQFAKGAKGYFPSATNGTLSTTNMQSVIDATQAFGSTRTLASPRIHAMNNQQAILSFVENQIYFTVKVDQTQSASTTGSSSGLNTVTVNSTLNSTPIGVILALQPSINLDNDEIIMNVRPTITTKTGTVNDPAVAYAIAQAGIKDQITDPGVPIVNIKEIDSVLKIKDGQIMVIGGMMEETSTNNDNGIPILMSVPFVGNLFKSTSKTNEVIQTVIFIKATIMHPDGTLKSDRDFYNSFARDKENIY